MAQHDVGVGVVGITWMWQHGCMWHIDREKGQKT